jgi:hypothetical protein
MKNTELSKSWEKVFLPMLSKPLTYAQKKKSLLKYSEMMKSHLGLVNKNIKYLKN